MNKVFIILGILVFLAGLYIGFRFMKNQQYEFKKELEIIKSEKGIYIK